MNGMCRKIAIAALIGLSGIPQVSANEADVQQAQDGLVGKLTIFFDPQKFQAWTQGKGGFNEATAVPAKLADTPFLVMVSAGNCKAAADGNCNVTADYAVFDPSGKKVVDDPRRKVWTKAAQPKGMVAFSEEPVPAMLQSSDPPGSYRLHIVLHDNNAGTAVELEQTLMLEARQ